MDGIMGEATFPLRAGCLGTKQVRRGAAEGERTSWFRRPPCWPVSRAVSPAPQMGGKLKPFYRLPFSLRFLCVCVCISRLA